MPVILINYWAVLVCGVVSMVLGFLWYGPLFGKKYLKYIGVSHEDMEKAKHSPAMRRQMKINYLTTFVFALISAFVLNHFLVIAGVYFNISPVSGGWFAAALGWLGFVVPSVLGGVLWERKPWGWFALVSGYYLVQLLIMATILGYWM